MTVEEIKSIIKEHMDVLRDKYSVKEIGLFGSYLRGAQKATSDIDVLVDFKEGADLFSLVGLAIFLEEKLGVKVDVVPKRALRKELREQVLKEVVLV
ncbi:MAG: nucleotidyltransferase family protein [candidate division WOR-3 bacterium]